MVKLIIGGGFDVLHQNHKHFIDKAISFVNPTGILARLKSDNQLNKTKGINRPLFSYDWRAKDLYNYLVKSYPLSLMDNIEVSNQEDADFSFYVNNSDYIILFKNTNKLEGVKNALYLEESQGIHTSSIPSLCNKLELSSPCNKIKVGTVLVRDGQIITYGCNGYVLRKSKKSSLNHCLKCYGNTNSNCEYLHAEEMVLDYSYPGDDIFISYSPCIYCAKEIVEKGIRRVVYFKEFHKLEGLNYLKEQGIEVRQAGL